MTHALLLQLAQTAPTPAADMHNTLLIWAAILFGLAIILFAMELMIPSAGILGSLSGLCLVAGVICFFRIDTNLGLISAIAVLIAMPFMIATAMRLWPHTPVGRLMILSEQQPADESRVLPKAPVTEAQRRQELLGAEGRTLTELRPVGTCLINDRRVECLAVGSTIPPDTAVKVVVVDGMTIKVQPV